MKLIRFADVPLGGRFKEHPSHVTSGQKIGRYMRVDVHASGKRVKHTRAYVAPDELVWVEETP